MKIPLNFMLENWSVDTTWESGQEVWRINWWEHGAEVNEVAWACFGTMEVVENEPAVFCPCLERLEKVW